MFKDLLSVVRFVQKVKRKLLDLTSRRLLLSGVPGLQLAGVYLAGLFHNYVDPEYLASTRILKLLESGARAVISNTGVLLIFCEKRVLKYPLCGRTATSLIAEFDNYHCMRERKAYARFVSYKLEAHGDYYEVQRLGPSRSSWSHRCDILQSFESEASGFVSLWDIVDRSRFKIAMSRAGIQDRLIENLLTQVQELGPLDSCPMHGDLTRFNIMESHDGSPLLIDLDRFAKRGIKGLDRIHFSVELCTKKRRLLYLEVLAQILSKGSICETRRGALLVYFCYRITNEYNPRINFREAYYEGVRKCASLLLVEG